MHQYLSVPFLRSLSIAISTFLLILIAICGTTAGQSPAVGTVVLKEDFSSGPDRANPRAFGGRKTWNIPDTWEWRDGAVASIYDRAKFPDKTGLPLWHLGDANAQIAADAAKPDVGLYERCFTRDINDPRVKDKTQKPSGLLKNMIAYGVDVLFWWRCGDPPADEHDSTSGGQWTHLQPQPLGNPMLPKEGRQYGNFAQAEGGFGPKIGFARELLAKEPGKKLAIVKAAFSGTGLRTD